MSPAEKQFLQHRLVIKSLILSHPLHLPLPPSRVNKSKEKPLAPTRDNPCDHFNR